MKSLKLPIKLPKIFKSEDPFYSVIDLGTAEVKVGICREKDDVKEREVLGTGTQPLNRGSIYGGKILDLDAVLDSTNTALESAVLKAGVRAKKAVLGLSGGIILPKSYRVRIRRQEPDAKMSEEEFDILARRVEDKTLAIAEDELKILGSQNYTQIETVFTTYQLDHAKVVTPIGLTGAEVEITVLHYYIETSKLRAINSLIEQMDLEVLSMVDTAVYCAVQWIEQYGDYILLDIGADVTQVVVVENGRVLESKSIFIGGYDITQEIQDGLGVSFENAESIKVSYTQGHLDQERARDVHRVVENVTDVITEGVVAAVKTSSTMHLPPCFVITGGSRHLTEVKTALASYPWAQESQFTMHPKIETVEGKTPNFTELTNIQL